jgi:hypothetical protein
MPIIGYFVFIGSLLITLLFAADRYLPAPADHTSSADIDKTVIRIHSVRNLPEKIVFDTRSAMTISTEAVAEGSRSDPSSRQ